MKRLVYELKCKCGRFFLYCFKRGRDFRCDVCRNSNTVEEIEKELRDMSDEEYQSFMEDIEEYNKEKLKK